MSTVSDENVGPGVALKGTSSQDGPPQSALKQSNKANIMSPPPSSKKKLDRGDGPAPADATLMKENLDQTVNTDPSATDDDDIISFKTPDAELDFESDPFKSKTQLANSPVNNNPQAMKNTPLSACSTSESSENQNQNQQEVLCQEKDVQVQSSSSEDASKNDHTPTFSALDPMDMSDPFKPKSQLVNSPKMTDDHEGTSENTQDSATSSVNVEIADVVNNELGESISSKSPGKTCLEPDESKVSEDLQVAADPFKVSSQLVNTPTKLDVDGDPFKPNSPITTADSLDPFKPSKQLQNSPEKIDGLCDSMKSENLVENSPKKSVSQTNVLFPDRNGENAPQKTADPIAQPSASTVKDSEIDQMTAESKQNSSTETSAQALGLSEFNSQAIKSSAVPDKNDQDIQDPFQPRKQLVNSPDNSSTESSIALNLKAKLADEVGNEEERGLLKPKTQLSISPKEPFSSDHMNASAMLKPNPASVSSEKGETASTVDPFTPKVQLMNSPLNAVVDPDIDVDPFKPKAQLANSPSGLSAEGLDPFKPNSQLANFPGKTEGICEEADPFKPKTQQANSPTKKETIEEMDPFQPKTQLTNSPTKPTETDSFKLTSQLAKSSDVNSASAVTQQTSSPMKAEETGPFKPKTQLVNSPEKTADFHANLDLFQPPKQLASTPPTTGESEIDPFKPKAQLANSPAKEDGILAEVNPFELETQLANSPPKTVDSATDPFKAKTQLVNSPVKGDEVNPFQPKTQLANSPSKSDETDPFKPSSQLTNSPAKDVSEEADPFKPKTQVANSPQRHEEHKEDQDPFQPKTQLMNSPAEREVAPESKPSKPESHLTSSPGKHLAEEDKGTTQNASSAPDCEDAVKSLEAVDETSNPAPDAQDAVKGLEAVDKTSNPVPDGQVAVKGLEAVDKTSNPVPDGQVAVKGLEAVDKTSNPVPDGQVAVKSLEAVNAASNSVLLASGQDLGLDENMFISGAQAFSDPAAWDLLEQFGGAGETKETDLRKCSLYVKFDPLVKPTLPRTPEKMPAPTHAAPRRAGAKSNDPLNSSQLNASQMNSSVGEESICLLGTPPKVSRRRSVLSQRRMNMSSVSQTITEEEQAKPVDLLFSLEGETSDDMFLNDPTKKPDTGTSTLVDVEEGAKYTEAQWQQLQQKLVMQYEGQMLARERKLAAQLEEKTATIEKLQGKLDSVSAEKKELSDKMASTLSCVQEYEKTLETLIVTKEKTAAELKSEIDGLKKERDQALEDVQALESSFAEFHRRYEKLKQTLEGFRKNEETLKETVKKLQEKIKVSDGNLTKMKAKAEETIEGMVKKIAEKESETARVEAELKRSKLQVHSLENTLTQKKQEVTELTELCDTLIAQVGGGAK